MVKLSKFIPEIKIVPNNGLHHIMGDIKLRKELFLNLPIFYREEGENRSIDDEERKMLLKFANKTPEIKDGVYIFTLGDDNEEDGYYLYITDNPISWEQVVGGIGNRPYNMDEHMFYWVPITFKGIKLYWSYT